MKLVEYAGEVPVIVEVAASTAAPGVRPAGARLDAIQEKAATTFRDSLKVIGEIGRAVRAAIEDVGIEEAEVKIGLKVGGTGQLIVAQTAVEGTFEVSFKVKHGA